MIDVTEAESLPLDARVIESGLARLWQLAADGSAGGVVHASSLTLVALLTDQRLASRAGALLAEVAPAHPCRAILVESAAGEPRARLGAFCTRPSAGRPPSCWEEIKLQGSRAALNRILSAVASLVLPNLPVQVWWPGDPDLSGRLCRRLVEIGDRMIVDSSQFGDPLASLARYAERVEAEHGTVGFADLSWRRLEPWRLLLAQFFDAPTDRVFLNDIESIIVTYAPGDGSGPGGLAQALLLVGWLASRLGWTVAAAGRTGQRAALRQDLERLVFDDGGRPVGVELRSRPSESSLSPDCAGGLVSVQLRATHDSRSAVYAIDASGENATTLAKVEGERRTARLHLSTMTEAELLQRELAAFGRDRIYEETLQIIRPLARRVGTARC